MLDHLIHSFDLPIDLMERDRREDLLDMEVILELLEFVTVELCSVIRYDGVGDSLPLNDVLVDKLLDLCRRDRRKHLCFNPLSEVVDSHYCVLHIPLPLGSRPIKSIP